MAGTFTIISVSNLGGSPPTYRLVVDSTSGMVEGDYITARKLSDNAAAIYVVIAGGVLDLTHVDVEDSLTQGNGGVEFGLPASGYGAYATPTTNLGLAQLPEDAIGWRALVEHNFAVLDSPPTKLSDGSTALTINGIVDGRVLKRVGDEIQSVSVPASAPAAHKASHVSGGNYSFTSADVLEAVVKRLQVTGPTTLTLDTVNDGQYLRRSGTTIVGSGGSTVLNSEIANAVGGMSSSDLHSYTLPQNTIDIDGQVLRITAQATVTRSIAGSNDVSLHFGSVTIDSVNVSGASGTYYIKWDVQITRRGSAVQKICWHRTSDIAHNCSAVGGTEDFTHVDGIIIKTRHTVNAGIGTTTAYQLLVEKISA